MNVAKDIAFAGDILYSPSHEFFKIVYEIVILTLLVLQWSSIGVEHNILCSQLAGCISCYQEFAVLFPKSRTIQGRCVGLGFRGVDNRREGTASLEGHKANGGATGVEQSLYIVLDAQIYHRQGA